MREANIMDGKAVASYIKNTVVSYIKRGIQNFVPGVPKLAVISVGDDQASKVYVRNKEKACAECGIEFVNVKLPSDTSEDLLKRTVFQYDDDATVSGIIVQLPLPEHLHAQNIKNCIYEWKDVDGFCKNSVFGQCTPLGIIEMLKYYNIEIDGAHVVIVGRSDIVGKPLAQMMLNLNATVTVCHSHTKNLADITRTADILVSAVGMPNLIKADMVREGATVIDVGINRVDGKLCGDVDFENVKNVAGYITPVPGGVGPMTVAMLMRNTVDAWSKY